MMTPGGEVIEGLVLCLVGDHRLAVRAREVTAFEAAGPEAPYAGARFTPSAAAPPGARLLRHEQVRLAVDSVEVLADRFHALSVPPVLSGACGGALSGFVEAGGVLWPVVSLAPFAAALDGPDAGARPAPGERTP